ncbi:hypothetical protein [Aurantiacibacter poecillastricola]|uniref:hypothetical protein n=1 Tax=Aurantiacibacter poecillastricola TaxID=3064385 RepID=UPI00273E936D|nr:hypothetical protein [Aurantiacibacter sp. 219JJ12-13]MDP5261274.1 hypothetical protein [Aurantiacibacter sp. 219JJ12-13]
MILPVVPLSALLALSSPPETEIAHRPALPTELGKAEPAVKCAHDVEAKLTSSQTLTPAVLDFNTASLIDPSRSEHLQGIARYDRDGRSYLFVSQSRKGMKAGILATVEMGTRDGGVWRSNRQLASRGLDGMYLPPPQADRVIAVKTDEGFSQYNHPGGLAIVGDVLAIGMEGAHDETVHPRGRVDFYRIESPTSLRLITSLANSGQYASSVAFTRLASGHYLLAVSDNSPKNIRLYRSTGAGEFDDSTEFEELAVFTESDLAPGDNKYFQNLDFITDCASGRLYMVLAFQDHDFWGLSRKNRLARYEIMTPGETPALRRLGIQKISCDPPLASNTCSFDASFGAYVTSEGQLVYYSSESRNTGMNGSVNFGELVP